MARSIEAQNEIANMSTIHGAPVEVKGGLPTYTEAKGVRARKLQGKAAELQEHMLEVGIRSASMVSIRPFPISPQGTHSSNYPLDPCPIGQKYIKKVIPCHEVAISNNEHGEEDVKAVLAIKIAEDIKQQLNKNGYRGLVVYMGEREPFGPKDPRDPEMRDIAREIAEEEKLMIEEFKGHLQRANDAHNNGKGRQLINDLHRHVAEWMLSKKLLKEPPAWLLSTRDEADVIAPCVCGVEPPTKETMFCKSCGCWIKPFEAAKAGLLLPTDDGGRMALQRCTKDQLIELGFYPHIKPFAESNADWMRQAKSDAKKNTPSQ